MLAVNTEDAIANPSYRPWSEVPITFSRTDRWANIPYTGRFPLVLDATVKKVLFRKVLIDGESALNLLFVGALKELDLGIEDLTPSNSSFWGVVPGRSNFHVEHINFYVTDFNTAYHAILGRQLWPSSWLYHTMRIWC